MIFKRQAINIIFLLGEVVDRGFVHLSSGEYIVRVRLKLRVSNKRNEFAYIDVYSNRKNAEETSLASQIGNILYLECSFRCAKESKHVGTHYICIKTLKCVRRPRDVKLPNTDVIELLDKIDPIGYMDEKINKRELKEEKSNG